MSLSGHENQITDFNPSLVRGDEQRLDIFLFRSRLIKTRAQAAKIIRMGRVRLERFGQSERVRKAHTKIKKGDIITFMRGSDLIHIEIDTLPHRRGPASEARSHYRDCAG